jgi:hypothetical protein
MMNLRGREVDTLLAFTTLTKPVPLPLDALRRVSRSTRSFRAVTEARSKSFVHTAGCLLMSHSGRRRDQIVFLRPQVVSSQPQSVRCSTGHLTSKVAW